MAVIWAITRNTITMTMRRRAPLVLLLFVVIGAPLLSLFAEGDNTLEGLLKLVITYNFTIMSGLLMLMMLYLSSTVLDKDISDKQIFLVDVKPVRRWELLCGKWLGLVILSGWLLLIMVSLSYIVIMALATSSTATTVAGRPYTNTRAAQLIILTVLAGSLLLVGGCLVYNSLAVRWERIGRNTGRVLLTLWIVGIALAMAWLVRGQRVRSGPGRAVDDVRRAYREFLTARHSYRPKLPNVHEEVERYKLRLKQQNRLDERQWPPEKLERHLRKILEKQLFPIEYGAAREFLFEGLPPAITQSEDVTVRYKLHGRRGSSSGGWLYHGWEVYNPNTHFAYPYQAQSKSGKTRSFNVPATLLGSGGDLVVRITNLTGPTEDQPPARLNVPLVDGIELLVPVGSFEVNLLRGALLLWIRLAMIAAIGIAANTFLSGPVAAFLVLMILAVGMGNSFVYKIVAPEPTTFADVQKPEPDLATQSLGARTVAHLTKVAESVLPTILTAAPDFDETDPLQDLTVGREIPWPRLAWQILLDLGLRAGVIVAIGITAFYRKEVGLPTIA